jgi:Protein of unknown function (DUF2786)
MYHPKRKENKMNVPEAILDKIRKLNALAENAGTEAEAANAASKIADLCLKHNIEIGSVQLSAEETSATEAREDVGAALQIHDAILAGAVNPLFQVDHYQTGTKYHITRDAGYVSRGSKFKEIVFYGLKANVQSALVTYQYLRASVESLLEGHLREGERWDRSECRSFRIGCATRIRNEAQKLARVQQNLIDGSTECTAIVLIGNALITAHAKALGLRTQKRQFTGARSSDAYGAGFAAGGRVDLHGARSNRLLN